MPISEPRDPADFGQFSVINHNPPCISFMHSFKIPTIHQPPNTSSPPYITPTIHLPHHTSPPPYIILTIHHLHHTSPPQYTIPTIHYPTIHHPHHTSSSPYIIPTIHHPHHTSPPPYIISTIHHPTIHHPHHTYSHHTYSSSYITPAIHHPYHHIVPVWSCIIPNHTLYSSTVPANVHNEAWSGIPTMRKCCVRHVLRHTTPEQVYVSTRWRYAVDRQQLTWHTFVASEDSCIIYNIG